MTLDPRISLYLNIVVGLLTALGAYASAFGPTGATVIGLLLAVANAVLHAIPSQNTPDAAKTFYLGPKA
jgi:hypothetical protein